MAIVPSSLTFDQSTMHKLMEADPVVQRCRAFLAVFNWALVPEPNIAPSRPGKRPHPQTAYLKALLLKRNEGFAACTQLRRYLLDHPLLVLELGFRPVLDVRQPYGFDVARTVPTARWFCAQQHRLDQSVLQELLAATVQDLRAEIPGLGEVVAFDVTHIYAFVKENNLRVYVKDRYKQEVQPAGDPDCRLGVKKGRNQEQTAQEATTQQAASCSQTGSSPTPEVKPAAGKPTQGKPADEKNEGKECLWGYGSGVATATVAGYGDVVLAEYTQPFNENDISYFVPLYLRTVAALGTFPTHLTADAAFDAWYVYQLVAPRGGIAAIPLNSHGHPQRQYAADGTPLCAQGWRMQPTFQFAHTNGYCSQRFRCPLLFPAPTGQTCPHEQFVKGKGCVTDPNWEAGGRMRVLLDRDSPLYHAIYDQRTSTERINSQSKALGIKRPLVRNLPSIRNLNTLTYLVLNARALQRARELNASLLTTHLKKIL